MRENLTTNFYNFVWHSLFIGHSKHFFFEHKLFPIVHKYLSISQAEILFSLAALIQIVPNSFNSSLFKSLLSTI